MNSESEKAIDTQDTSQGNVFENLSVNIPLAKSNKRVRATITSGFNDNEDFRVSKTYGIHDSTGSSTRTVSTSDEFTFKESALSIRSQWW